MLIIEYIICFFALGALFTAIQVITKKNPVHSVFFLVCTFANTSALLLLLGVEFLAIIFWIVYVGAIAILFIFVIKLINIKLVEFLDNSTRYFPIGLIIGVALFLEISVYLTDDLSPNMHNITEYIPTNITQILSFTNIEQLGKLLYTDLALALIIAGLILLLALIAAILLTLGHEEEIKRQDIFNQVARSSSISFTV